MHRSRRRCGNGSNDHSGDSVIIDVICLKIPMHKLTLFSFSILVLGVIGCSTGSKLVDKQAMNDFWAWFEENEGSIVSAMTSGDTERIRTTINDVDSRMQKVTPGISFVFGGNDAGFEFVVTAHGDVDYFPNVQAFVDASPEIEGWEIVAFRPPSTSIDSKMKIGGIEIGATDIKFQAFDVVGGIGITLYPTGMTEENRDLYSHAAVLILDYLVGEFVAGTKIESLMVEPLSNAEHGVPMRPLTDLPEYLDKHG